MTILFDNYTGPDGIATKSDGSENVHVSSGERTAVIFECDAAQGTPDFVVLVAPLSMKFSARRQAGNVELLWKNRRDEWTPLVEGGSPRLNGQFPIPAGQPFSLEIKDA